MLMKGKCWWFKICHQLLQSQLTSQKSSLVMWRQLCGFILMILPFCLTQEAYQKIIHNVDPDAKCLDGSPAVLYLHEGDPHNILFYFQGGGVCGDQTLNKTVENCYQRSKTYQGSSIYWAQTLKAEGILSTDPNKNIFANWTKVIMIYCDGAFHQGYTKAPLKYKDAQLYFRGALITRAHFKYINNRFKLNEAQKIVISGSSAGGMSAFAWSDYVKSLILNSQASLYIIAQSAILLKNDEAELSNLFQLSNKDENVPNIKCGNQYDKASEWNCLTLPGALTTLQTETLFISSAYDQFIISLRLGINCLTTGLSGYSLIRCSSTQMQQISEYHTYYMNYLNKILERGHNIWSIGCSWHSVLMFDSFYESPFQKVPHTSGETMQQAIYSFVIMQNKVINIDVGQWPSNIICAF